MRRPRLSPSQRRRLMLALAAAEERLMRAHANAAADFIGEIAQDLPFDRALRIYLRLLEVPAGERRAVTVRALAHLQHHPPASGLELETSERAAGPLGRLSRRVRGRRQPQLRERVDAAAVRARRAVRGAHLDGAAAVTAALDGVLGPAEAVQTYLDALDLSPGWAARIFHDSVATVPETAD